MKLNGLNMEREQWYRIWQRARYWEKPVDPLEAKQEIIDSINNHSHNGVVRLCSRFMDCDCSIATDYTEIPATYYSYVRHVEELYRDAEGPGSVWLDHPNGPRPDRGYRDLALEAFEDGHPHVVWE